MRDFAFVRDKSTTLGDLIDIPWQSVRCHSTMVQITMAHASMASPLWCRSSLAHSGMARSSRPTAQFWCRAVSVWRRFRTAHFSMAWSTIQSDTAVLVCGFILI